MAKQKKELPKISVLERRIAHPFGMPSEAITLKEGDWVVRWVNEGVRTGRVYQVQNMGWDFVSPEELKGQPQDVGCQALDGRLVRGDAASRDVLMKMPKADFHEIQQAKSRANLKGLGSGAKNREDAANRAAKAFGDEAADAIYRSGMEVTDERVSMDLEGEAPPR